MVRVILLMVCPFGLSDCAVTDSWSSLGKFARMGKQEVAGYPSAELFEWSNLEV